MIVLLIYTCIIRITKEIDRECKEKKHEKTKKKIAKENQKKKWKRKLKLKWIMLKIFPGNYYYYYDF